MDKIECGFYAVNGKHCVITDHCIVCRQPAEKAFTKGDEITLIGLDGLDGKYRIVALFKDTLQLEFLK